MKNRLILILAVVLSMATTVFGAYSVPQIDAEVTLPSSLAAATGDVKDGDKILEYFNTDTAGMKKLLNDGNMYLMAYDPNAKVQLQISSSPAFVGADFVSVSDSDLLSVVNAEKYQSAQGLACYPDSFCVFDNGQTKFVRYDEYHEQYSNFKIINYYTEANKKGILVSVRCYSEEIEPNQRELADSAVRGIKFTKLENSGKTQKIDTSVSAEVPTSKITSSAESNETANSAQTQKSAESKAPAKEETGASSKTETKSAENTPSPTASDETAPQETETAVSESDETPLPQETEETEAINAETDHQNYFNTILISALAVIFVAAFVVGFVLYKKKKSSKQ